MKLNTIAAQLYTLRDFTTTPNAVAKTFSKVKELGYSAVQVSGMGPVDPAYVSDLATDLGLSICATHVPYNRLKNDLSSIIYEHKLWKCDYVGIGMMPDDFERSYQGYTSFSHEASEIGRNLANEGLKLIYHNHYFEFQKYDGITAMDILIEESDPKALGFEIDTYWVQAGGGSPLQWLRKVAGRIDVVHLKDMEILDSQQVMAEIGQGNMDWPSIIQTCREIGVKWYAVEQDVCRRNPFDSLSISYNYLKKLALPNQ